MFYKVYKNEYSKEIRNLCVLCLYLYTDEIPDYTLHYILQLKKCGYDTMVVSHSEINTKGIERLEKHCCGVVVKENKGYDFFAWKQGLELCENGIYLESLLLTNDSIIGPLNDMGPIFKEMKNFDFWGLTENLEHSYHIQSYFLHANKNVIHSERWIAFWEELKVYESRLDIVINYEVELSQALLKEDKITIGAWVSTKSIQEASDSFFYAENPKADYWYGISNPTIRHWKNLITKFGFPFVKKNLFFDKEHYHVLNGQKVNVYNVYPVNWKNILFKTFGLHAVSLVENYLNDFYSKTKIYKNVVNEQYKIVFIYKDLKSRSSTEFLIRVLNFYNNNNITTELIVEDSEHNISEALSSKLNDISKVIFLRDLNNIEREEHKYQLSCDKIGILYLGNVESAKLAAAYFYTGAALILIADRNGDDSLIRNFVDTAKTVKATIITPLPAVHQKLTQRNVDCLLLDTIGEAIHNENDDHSGITNLLEGMKKGLIVGLIGVNDINQHRNHLLYFIESIVSNVLIQKCILFLNKEEHSQFNNLQRTSNFLPDKIRLAGKFQIVEYTSESLAGQMEVYQVSTAITYWNLDVVPDHIISVYERNIPLAGVFNEGVLNEIFQEKEVLFRFNYFDTGRLFEHLNSLASDSNAYLEAVKQTKRLVGDYLGKFDNRKGIQAITTDIVDFSELRKPIPKITVIFHFHFYEFDNVSFRYYKRRLRAFLKNNVNFLFSITSDSYDIKGHAQSLQETFVNSSIKVVPNKGRDIGAKFLLFDYYFKCGAGAEYLVVLHDKKSLHLPYWEARAWIESLLKIIQPEYCDGIIRRFENYKNVGIIGSRERLVDCIIRWDETGAYKRPVFEWNNDLLHDLIDRYSIKIDEYNFVGGTMFWIKNEVLEMIQAKYNFLNRFEELEEGNVMDNNGSTITHCWERLLCWISTDLGFKVSGI